MPCVARQHASSTGAIFDMPDQKTIVIGIIHGLAGTDFPPAELQATDLIQLAASIEALILGHMFVFTIAARGRNHLTPHFLGEGL
jgi:hypothetical protein